MSDKSRKRKILFDSILIGALLCIGLSAFFIFRAVSDVGPVAQVWIDNRLVSEYPLSVDGEYSLKGGTNILKIEGGTARIVSANCKNQICVNSGKISYEHERIVCSPNKIEVTVSVE